MQGPPAVLINQTFSEFRDNCKHVQLDHWICQNVVDFNELMSPSYQTPIPESELDEDSVVLLRDLGVDLQSQDSYQPSSDNFEDKQMAIVRRFLSGLLWDYAAADVKSSVGASHSTQVWPRIVAVLVTHNKALLACHCVDCMCRMLKIPVTAMPCDG